MADKPAAPERWGDLEEQARKIAQVANQLQKGQGNNSRKVVLGTGTSTEVLISFVRSDHVATLSAQDAGSASSMAGGNLYAQTSEGKVTIFHDASEDTRTIALLVNG